MSWRRTSAAFHPSCHASSGVASHLHAQDKHTEYLAGVTVDGIPLPRKHDQREARSGVCGVVQCRSAVRECCPKQVTGRGRCFAHLRRSATQAVARYRQHTNVFCLFDLREKHQAIRCQCVHKGPSLGVVFLPRQHCGEHGYGCCPKQLRSSRCSLPCPLWLAGLEESLAMFRCVPSA